jgi:hypothetical protein
MPRGRRPISRTASMRRVGRTVSRATSSGGPGGSSGGITGGTTGATSGTGGTPSGTYEALVKLIFDYLINNAPSIIEKKFAQDWMGWKTTTDFIKPELLFADNIQNVVLSPVGVIHLYRQYFFELDSFLGSPVAHVWLSPGGTLELNEVQRRRTLTEREVRALTETRTVSETSTTTQEELSSAIKEDNSRNESLGVTVTSGGGFPGIFHADASINYGLQTTNQRSQETAHKFMRQQSEKLTSEIRRSFQTSFRTTIETEDVTTRRHVIQNNTAELKNYELRRKMRKVGIQVQHIGTELCWQMYIDDPGREVGLAELVHIAKPADLSDGMIRPEMPEPPKPAEQEITIEFPWMYVDGTTRTDLNKLYRNVPNTGQAYGDFGTAIWNTKEYQVAPPNVKYKLAAVSQYSVQRTGENIPLVDPIFEVLNGGNLTNGVASFKLTLGEVHFGGNPSIVMRVKLLWTTDFSLAQTDYEAKMKEYNAEVHRKTKEAYVDAVKERITLASKIEKRPPEDLRKEERILVYRKLVSQLIGANRNPTGSRQTSHVLSELIRAIFDIDKMLYFVAPDWWLPKAHKQMQQVINHTSPTPLTGDDLVGWGGVNEKQRENYLITEDSEPAELGSSIGWLLQLDGDEHRNAFLNSPWVKAVIPIRAGMEKQAIAWLTGSQIEYKEGLDAEYEGKDKQDFKKPPNRKLTIRDAIEQISEKLEGIEEDPKNIEDVEKVFETGFDPLQDGFKWKGQQFKIFDQWIEILPTEQVVAFEYQSSSSNT